MAEAVRKPPIPAGAKTCITLSHTDICLKTPSSRTLQWIFFCGLTTHCINYWANELFTLVLFKLLELFLGKNI